VVTTRRTIDGTGNDAVSAKLDQIRARLEVIEAGLKTWAGATSLNPARSARAQTQTRQR